MRSISLTGFALFGLLAQPAIAELISEVEPNQTNCNYSDPECVPLADAQPISLGGGEVNIAGELGPATFDVDFYRFTAHAEQVLDIAIQDGIDGQDSVRTHIAVFGPGPSYDHAGLSATFSHAGDPAIEFAVQTPGTYVVGVSSAELAFTSDGKGRVPRGTMEYGDYTLVIAEKNRELPDPALPDTVQIDVQPRGRGTVHVAILSEEDFDAPSAVDHDSLLFGASGTEDSLKHCAPRGGRDVNGDGLKDLVCLFDASKTGLGSKTEEAVLTGALKADGQAISAREKLAPPPHARR